MRSENRALVQDYETVSTDFTEDFEAKHHAPKRNQSRNPDVKIATTLPITMHAFRMNGCHS